MKRFVLFLLLLFLSIPRVEAETNVCLGQTAVEDSGTGTVAYTVANVNDGNIATYFARSHVGTPGPAATTVTINFPEMTTKRFKFAFSNTNNGAWNVSTAISLYYGGSWHSLWSETTPRQDIYIQSDIVIAGVSGMRATMSSSTSGGMEPWAVVQIYEMELWKDDPVPSVGSPLEMAGD